jgi:hypothetical protein
VGQLILCERGVAVRHLDDAWCKEHELVIKGQETELVTGESVDVDSNAPCEEPGCHGPLIEEVFSTNT